MRREAANVRQAGFTLLEVLLSVFLLALLLSALYSAFFVITDAVTATEGTVIKLQEARATMDIMRRELEAAITSSGLEVLDRDVYGAQTSTLTFETHGSAIAGGSHVSYFITEAEDGRLSLIKQVSLIGQDPGSPDARSSEVEAVEDVISFEVEARDKEKWNNTWREDRWAEDIRVTLTIRVHGADLPLIFTTRPYMGRTL